MKIGLAQIDCALGDLSSNCAKFAEYASRAKLQGCDIVIFPEMSDTGYEPAVIAGCAAPWPGPSLDAASAAAADNSINLICGISERTEHAIYNTMAFLNSSGQLLGKYRKTHLFSSAPIYENKIFTPGNELTLLQLDGVSWGPTICYDLRFPELYRALTLEGAELLLNCAAWPAARPTHWDCLTRARAVENQAFFVGVDRVGTDRELKMHGHSRVVTPRGDILCEGTGDKEELLVADIDVALIEEFRNAIPAMSARRTDVYSRKPIR